MVAPRETRTVHERAPWQGQLQCQREERWWHSSADNLVGTLVSRSGVELGHLILAHLVFPFRDGMRSEVRVS
jgi:hypothetical protein